MNLSYRLGWTFFRVMFAVYFRWRVFNPERVPLTGGVIIASNHASILDPPLVGSGLHRGINYLARESLFRFFGIGALLRSWSAAGDPGPVARRRRNYFVSRRHAHAGR